VQCLSQPAHFNTVQKLAQWPWVSAVVFHLA